MSFINNKLKIEEKDPIEIYVDGSSIILKKYQENCVFCGSTKKVVDYKGKLICSKCMENIASMNQNLKDE